MATQSSELAYLEKMPVFDLHCDTLDRLALRSSKLYEGFVEQNASEGISVDRLRSLYDNDAHVSLARMKFYAWCQCFAIFIPDTLQAEDSWRLYLQVRDFYREQCELYPYEIAALRDPNEIPTTLAAEKCAAFLTVEGTSFFADSLAPLDTLELDGVRMVTLTWNGKNAIASGNQTQDGFTSFGREVVKGLENRHIAVDVSHLNDKGFAELLDFSRRPFVASHSNSRAICDNPRNLSDDQFRAISERAGIVGLTYCNEFLTTEKREPTLEDLIRHISHWLEMGGERCIALGSDYDGSDVPLWLKPADKVYVVYQEVARVFGDYIAKRLFFDNAYEFFIRNAKL